MDYKKTSVRINNEKEFTKAVEFFLKKWYNYTEWCTTDYDNFKYVRVDEDNMIKYWSSYDRYCIWHKDITQEVLWWREFKVWDKVIVHKPEDKYQWPWWVKSMDSFDGSVITIKYVYDDYICAEEEGRCYSKDRCTQIFIDEACNTETKYTFHHGLENSIADFVPIIYDLISPEPKNIIPQHKNILSSKKNKPMSTLSQEIFERFIKSNKTKVIEAVEKAEEIWEEFSKLINPIGIYLESYIDAKENLERAFDEQDKEEIKVYLERIQKFNATFDDKLFDQLRTILKAINKSLSK